MAPATPVVAHTGLVGEAPGWARTVVVGTLFAGVVAALAALYSRRLWAAWRARISRWFAWRAAVAQQARLEQDPVPWPQKRARWLRTWWQWERAGEAPQPPPPPPEGTPEYHEWEEMYADRRPDVQAEEARIQAEIAQQEAAQQMGHAVPAEERAEAEFARQMGEEVRVEAVRGQILTPSQVKVRLPKVQYAYPYHGRWYDLQHGEYREHKPPISPLLTATPTPPLIYHPTPPPSISTSTVTPGPSATPTPPFWEPLPPAPCPVPTPPEATFLPPSPHATSSAPTLPELVGIRIDWSLGKGTIGVDFNVDAVYFSQSKEIGVFISPPLVQTGFTGGSSLSAGILWGKGFSSEGYAGTAFVQGIHTPPFVIPLGETLIPVPGIEFERAWSSSAVVYYLGIATGPEVGVYEEPSYAIRLWHFSFP